MRLPRVPRLALCALLALPLGAQDDWPTHRHDARRSGVTRSALDAATLQPAWEHQSGLPRPAWHGPARWDAYAALEGLRSMRDYDAAPQPIVAAGGLYLASTRDDSVRRFDARTGEPDWVVFAEGPVRIAPTYADGRLYFGADDGAAYCVDAQSGALLWRHVVVPEAERLLHDGRLISTWPVRTGVVVEDGVAYFGASMLPWEPSYLCALDAERGEVRSRDARTWVREHAAGLSLEGALLASADTLVVPQGRIAPLLFARATGDALGALAGGGGSFCLLSEDDQVLHGPGNKTGWITASASDSRAQIATYDKGRSVVLDGERAYLLSDRALSALDGPSRSVRWSRSVERPSALILAGQDLVIGSDGALTVRAAEDGALRYQAELDGRVHGLAVAGGWLYATTDTGLLQAYAPGGAPQSYAEVAPSEQELGRPPALARVSSEGLVAHYAFQSDTAVGSPPTAFRNLVEGGLPARSQGPLTLAPAGALHAVELGGRGDLLVGGDFLETPMPTRALTVEAWARVDEPIEWGGLVGASQDNGNYERGWVLGFRQDRFGFALAGAEGTGHQTWLTAPDSFVPGSWHQVVGVYDGAQQVLYVDGSEVARTSAESGDIAYPERAYFAIGSYRDDDEHFRLDGALQSCSLYARALTAEEIEARWAARADALPAPIEVREDEGPAPSLVLASGPSLRFTGAGRARIEAWLEEPAALELVVEENGREVARVGAGFARRDQSFALSDLGPRRLYHVHFEQRAGDELLRTRTYELDTHLDLTPSAVAGEADARSAELVARLADQNGVGLLLGLEDGALLAQLAAAGHSTSSFIQKSGTQLDQNQTRVVDFLEVQSC